MGNVLYSLISFSIILLTYVLFNGNILLCSDHRNYALTLEFAKGVFGQEYQGNFGLDSIIKLIYSVNNNIQLNTYFLSFTLLPVFIYLYAIFLLKDNLNKYCVGLMILSPVLFSITFGHLWTCGYRQGASTSFLILFFAILKTLRKRENYKNIIMISFAFIGGCISHWTFILLFLIFITFDFKRLFISYKYLFRRNYNLRFIISFFSILLITLLISITFRNVFSDAIFLITGKFGLYEYENTISNVEYGTKFPVFLFLAYTPHVIMRSLIQLKSKNTGYIDDQFLLTFSLYIICFLGLFSGFGDYIRIILPLQLISIINILMNLNFYSKNLYFSSILTMAILLTGSLYYMYTRMITFVPI